MASNGLLNRAKRGTCHICRRSRCTIKHVKEVGEVRHGMATGYVWECIEDCTEMAKERLENFSLSRYVRELIKQGLERGRFTYYKVFR